jgi:hypothetical protein
MGWVILTTVVHGSALCDNDVDYPGILARTQEWYSGYKTWSVAEGRSMVLWLGLCQRTEVSKDENGCIMFVPRTDLN